jgi:hypothetical protein
MYQNFRLVQCPSSYFHPTLQYFFQRISQCYWIILNDCWIPVGWCWKLRGKSAKFHVNVRNEDLLRRQGLWKRYPWSEAYSLWIPGAESVVKAQTQRLRAKWCNVMLSPSMLHAENTYNKIHTLHYVILHYITLHYTTLHYTRLYTLCYTTSHYITLHNITHNVNHCNTLKYVYFNNISYIQNKCVWLCNFFMHTNASNWMEYATGVARWACWDGMWCSRSLWGLRAPFIAWVLPSVLKVCHDMHSTRKGRTAKCMDIWHSATNAYRNKLAKKNK